MFTRARVTAKTIQPTKSGFNFISITEACKDTVLHGSRNKKEYVYTVVETIMCDCSCFHNGRRRRVMRAGSDGLSRGKVKSVLSKHFSGSFKNIKGSLITVRPCRSVVSSRLACTELIYGALNKRCMNLLRLQIPISAYRIFA